MIDEHKWFYLGAEDMPHGPVNREKLLELVRTGPAGESALVWRDGYSGWRPFREVEQEIRNPGAPAAAAAASPRKVKPTEAALQQVASATREVATGAKTRISKPLDRLSAAVRARPAIPRTQLAVGAAFAAAAIVIVSTLYSYSGPLTSDQLPDVTLAAVPEPPVTAEAPVESGPVPVRVHNPFDKSEVFEFPPGTGEVEARDAVADLLLKRALERRSTVIDRRAKKKKKKRT